MPEYPVRLYEGLFLLNQNAAADLNAAIEHLQDIFRRAEAEVLVLRKWDERKLAYEIHGQKRGTYLLAYFKVKSNRVAQIDRDCNLSERITRNLIIDAEHIGEVELELARKETTLAAEAKLRSPEPAAAPEAEIEEVPDVAAALDESSEA